jgi:hypothetical protein
MKSTFSNIRLFIVLATISMSANTTNAMEQLFEGIFEGQRMSSSERESYEARIKVLAERLLRTELELATIKELLAEARSGRVQSARELEDQKEAFIRELAEAARLLELAREAANPS